LTAGGAAVLVALTTVAYGQSQHLAEAMTHAQAAVVQGKQGYPDALVTQTQEAHKQASPARKETANQHLDEGIRQLQTAIEQGKQRKGDAATHTVERALAYLSEGTTPASTSASGAASSPLWIGARQKQVPYHEPMRNAGVHNRVANRVKPGSLIETKRVSLSRQGHAQRPCFTARSSNV